MCLLGGYGIAGLALLVRGRRLGTETSKVPALSRASATQHSAVPTRSAGSGARKDLQTQVQVLAQYTPEPLFPHKQELDGRDTPTLTWQTVGMGGRGAPLPYGAGACLLFGSPGRAYSCLNHQWWMAVNKTEEEWRAAGTGNEGSPQLLAHEAKSERLSKKL